MVDEVDLAGVEPGALVAVEVVAEGRAYRALADPIALTAALQLKQDQIHHVAEFTRELADSPAIAVTSRTGPLEAPATDDDYVDCRIDGEVMRYPPAQAHSVLRLAPPGNVVGVRIAAIPTAEHGMAVDDAYGAKQWREGSEGAPDEIAYRTEKISRATCRAVAEYAFRTAREVTQSMYDLAGPTAVFATKTPLDRLLRDAVTMSQHLLLSDSFLEIIGGTMIGDRSPIGWL